MRKFGVMDAACRSRRCIAVDVIDRGLLLAVMGFRFPEEEFAVAFGAGVDYVSPAVRMVGGISGGDGRATISAMIRPIFLDLTFCSNEARSIVRVLWPAVGMDGAVPIWRAATWWTRTPSASAGSLGSRQVPLTLPLSVFIETA